MVKYKICKMMELTAASKLIYCYLLDITNENQECSISIGKIGKQLGLSKRAVSCNLHRLEEYGYLHIIPQKNVDGGRSVNNYVLR